MRDNNWLKNQLEKVLQNYFSDLAIPNDICVKFGSNARTRLGSIRKGSHKKYENFTSEITITGFFKDERVPEYIIDLTIAHELCHYAHGFFSLHQRKFKHPHLGGLVDQELITRGLGDKLIAQKKWLKSEWPFIVGIPKRKPRLYSRRFARPKTILDLFFG